MKNDIGGRRYIRLRSVRTLIAFLGISGLLLLTSCLPKPVAETGGGINLTVYAFSIMKEPLEKAIYPAFVSKWKRERGQDIHFTSSYAGSETVTNQILQGVKADLAILSIAREADRLKKEGAAKSDWRQLPHNGFINKTPFVIIVRKGNPKKIRDFPDLAQRGLKLIHPDPTSSGGAQWSILAIYGSELVKSERSSGVRDTTRALNMLRAVWKNVISTPGSAREARTQFETGFGDALITYELEGLMMKEANAPIDMIVPEATIFSEHPIVIIDRNVKSAGRPILYSFVQYCWTEDAQRAFVKFNFRSVTHDALNQADSGFAQIKLPFTVGYFGGWDRAYVEIIEGIFRTQVQKGK